MYNMSVSISARVDPYLLCVCVCVCACALCVPLAASRSCRANVWGHEICTNFCDKRKNKRVCGQCTSVIQQRNAFYSCTVCM